jgi:hypothetical protein
VFRSTNIFIIFRGSQSGRSDQLEFERETLQSLRLLLVMRLAQESVVNIGPERLCIGQSMSVMRAVDLIGHWSGSTVSVKSNTNPRNTETSDRVRCSPRHTTSQSLCEPLMGGLARNLERVRWIGKSMMSPFQGERKFSRWAGKSHASKDVQIPKQSDIWRKFPV